MLRNKIQIISISLLLTAFMLFSILSADAANYTYDSLSRITMAEYESGFIEEYTYDLSGNRLMLTVTSKWISGTGCISPESESVSEISVNIRASSLETGMLTYNASEITLLSTEITGLIIDGGTAVIKGKCILNGLGGYSYIATLTDTEPDTVKIETYNPDGTAYFSTNKDILVSGDLSLGTEPLNQYLLTTSLSPAGSGSLSPDCSISCSYEKGTSLTITANENIGYGFINWSGCDSAANNICVITMDNDRTADALFESCGDPVRLMGAEPAYFSSLQNAYDASQDGNNIQIQNTLVSTNIYFDRDVSITVRGGYNCTYQNNSETTTLEGSMTISSGTVTIGGFIIK